MATVQDAIVYPAFQDLGVLAPGETNTTIRDAAFLLLQQLMESLSVEQVMNHVVYHQAFTLTAGTAVYTVGTAGTLVSTARPERITGWQSVSGNIKNGGRTISFEELHATMKDPLGSRSVLAAAVAADMAYPAVNIQVFPTPDTAPGALTLDYFAPLPVFAAVGDTVTLPDGWILMLRLNLALALSPQYARPGGAPKELLALAQNAKSVIAEKNAAILGLVQNPQAA